MELETIDSDWERLSCTFEMVPGLAGGDRGYVSFNSLNFPGHFMRHQDFRIKLQFEGQEQLFKDEASFLMVNGLADHKAVSFESYNYPGYYLRHRDFHLYLEKDDQSQLFKSDTTFWLRETSQIEDNTNLSSNAKPHSQNETATWDDAKIGSGSQGTPIHGLKLLDHSIASQVDESTYEVITRTSTFQPWDSRTYSWISLGNVDKAHRVDWNWYAPDGSIYDTFSQNIPGPKDKPWAWFNVYSYIDIAGNQPANMPGTWHVDVLLDGQKILTEQFTLLGGNLGTDSFGTKGNKGKDNSGGEEMHGGCYTDPASGQTICVDYFGPSGSGLGQGGLDEGNPQTSQTPSGGCYQDPLTGEVICVDETGGPEDLSAI